MSDYHHDDTDIPPESAAASDAAAPWERRVAIIVAALLVIVTAGWAWWQYVAPRGLDIPDHTLAQRDVQGVIQIVNGAVIHEEVAERFAEQYGTDALGILVPIIRDITEDSATRGRAAYILGKYRQPQYTQDIINVIEQNLQPGMGSPGLAGVAYSMEGLGWAGDDLAIQALKTIAGETFWEQRRPAPYKFEPDDAPRIQRLLRRRAVLALGRAPDGAGIEALKQLADSSPALSEPIDQALSAARRSRWGLAD